MVRQLADIPKSVLEVEDRWSLYPKYESWVSSYEIRLARRDPSGLVDDGLSAAESLHMRVV